MHRLEAAKALSWESIRATVFNGINADQAQLAEIDENLCRAELGPPEEAAHLAARKAIYLRLHPETGRGGDRSKSQNETLAPAFIDDTAARTGKGRATIARQTARGERIDDVGSLAGTSLDKGIELDALSKMSKSEQHELIARAKAGEQISAKSPSTSINSIPDPYALETLKGLPVPGRIQIVTGIFSTLTNDEIRAALPAQVKAELVQSAVDLEKSRASQDRHELEELVEDVCRAMATNEPVERQAEHVKHIVKEFKGRNRRAPSRSLAVKADTPQLLRAGCNNIPRQLNDAALTALARDLHVAPHEVADAIQLMRSGDDALLARVIAREITIQQALAIAAPRAQRVRS